MSYEEQQRDELDALAAIYPNEFELIKDIDEDKKPKFSIKVTSEVLEEDIEEDKYELTLLFILSQTYPDVGPEIEILSSENLEDADEIDILDELNEMIPDNLGIAMVFTLVSKAFEWINALKDRKKLEREEEAIRKKKELEELEHKKFEGTRVTVESFISWKLKFDAEMNILKKVVKIDDSKRLTGKEMFLQDKNLIDSDLNFGDVAEEVEDSVKVDESLFLDEDLPIDE